MAKKLLCVVISVLMVVSLLPMGVMAEDLTVTIGTTTYTVALTVSSSDFDTVCTSNVIDAQHTYSTAMSFYNTLKENVYTNGTSGVLIEVTASETPSVNLQLSTGSGYPLESGKVTATDTSGVYVVSVDEIVENFSTNRSIDFWDSSYSFNSVYSNTKSSITQLRILVPVDASSTPTTVDTSGWSVALSGYTSGYQGWGGVSVSGLTGSFTVQDVIDANSSVMSSASDVYGINVQIWNLDGSQADCLVDGTTVYYLITINGETVESGSTTIDEASNGYDSTTVVGLSSNTYTFAATDVITVTVSLTAIVAESESTSRTNGVIYVNEEYHGVLLTRTSDGGETYRTYLACVPHTVASNGYCTVCHMYIGTDEEAGTATIDGVEYDAAFSSDVKAAAGNWNKVSLGDSSFAAALSTEGALLVITRDSESTISYVSGEAYEKFMIGKDDSNHVDLATVGTTAEDEEGLVAFTSDDGTTAIYDGATVYAALEAAGMADLDSYVLISNTSGSYTITNVSVYVPAGTIVSEDVGVDEPAEEGETETEDDGEDLTVEDETPAPAETNPTTGVALALVPMAIAGFAVVSSKRR